MAYYTDEERKTPISKRLSYYTVETCFDLSCGVRFKKWVNYQPTKEMLMQDVANFMMFWTMNHFEKLNGFQGINTIKFIEE